MTDIAELVEEASRLAINLRDHDDEWDQEIVAGWEEAADLLDSLADALEALDRENQALAQTANAEISGFTTEWGIAYDESSASTVQIPTHDEAEARSEVADSPTDTGLIKRSVGPWIQVTT